MNIDEARAQLKGLGEFSSAEICSLDTAAVLLHFVKYEPGAFDGKFHKHKSITLPRAVFEQLKNELK